MKAGARVVTVVPLVGVAVIMAVFARPPWTALRVAGAVLAVAGFTLLTLARVQLGDAFSVTPQARMLVTRGLYSRIRHPVYVFSMLGIAGLSLYLRLPAILLLLLIIVPVQIVRARAEERVLEKRFGESYREYKRQTWF